MIVERPAEFRGHGLRVGDEVADDVVAVDVVQVCEHGEAKEEDEEAQEGDAGVFADGFAESGARGDGAAVEWFGGPWRSGSLALCVICLGILVRELGEGAECLWEG